MADGPVRSWRGGWQTWAVQAMATAPSVVPPFPTAPTVPDGCTDATTPPVEPGPPPE